MKRNVWLYLSIIALLALGVLLGTGDGKQAAAAPALESWTPAASLPIRMAGELVHCPDMPDSFYLVSGIMLNNNTTNRLYRYDISSDSWTGLANMPKVLRMPATACYQGKIYVAGGTDLGTVSQALLIYDIAGDAWSSGPDLPDPVLGGTMGVWDNQLYLVGGSRIFYPWTPESRVDVYDIASGVWNASGGEDMPTAASFAASAQAGQFLYVVGGMTGNVVEDQYQNVDQTQRYDMSTNTWEIGPTFTSARALGKLAVTGTHLYMLGGDIDGGTTFDMTDLVEALDLADWPGGAWADLSNPLPVANLYPATTCSETLSGGEIWDVGGGDSALSAYQEVYYLPTGQACTDIYSGDLLQEEMSLRSYAGEVAHYELTVYNAGTGDDAYDVTVSGNTWQVTAPVATSLLVPGETAVLMVDVAIPAEAVAGELDSALITITSQAEPAIQDTAALTTLVTEWVAVADLPHTLGLSAHVQCDDEPNFLYVIGGAEGYDTPTNTAFRYDVLTDSWEQLADLPVNIYGQMGACVEGKIYLVDWVQSLHIYDIATDTWSTEAGVPRIAEGAALGAWNNQLYLVGGSSNTNYEAIAQVDIYDIATHTWTAEGGAPLPQATTYAGAVQTGPYLYLAGGMSEKFEGVPWLQRYDMATDSWQTADYPSNFVFPALAATSEYLYALGGDPPGDELWTASELVQRLALDEWLLGNWEAIDDPLLTPSMGASTFCTDSLVEGEIWHIGGGTGSTGITYADSLYHPAEPCWQLSYGITATPVSELKLGKPGEALEYTLTVTNLGTAGDTFDISLSDNLWVTTAPTTTGWLEPGATIDILVSVTIPLDALPGAEDTAVVTFTSQHDPETAASATLTSRVPFLYNYLPIVLRWPLP